MAQLAGGYVKIRLISLFGSNRISGGGVQIRSMIGTPLFET